MRTNEGYIHAGLTLSGILRRVDALNTAIYEVTINLIYIDEPIIPQTFYKFKSKITNPLGLFSKINQKRSIYLKF